jgi:hypothetical protein
MTREIGPTRRCNFPDGWWTSKLGPDEDILHRTPQALLGDLYGQVRKIMKRTTPASSGGTI